MSISLRSRIWSGILLAALLLSLLGTSVAPSLARAGSSPAANDDERHTPPAVEVSIEMGLFAEPYCPDYFVEPDDDPLLYIGSADPNDAPYQRAFCTDDDVDWYRFTANAGDAFVIETSIPNPDQIGVIADPTLTLYRQDPHGFTQLAYDDNSGQNLGARIVYTAPSSGELFVAARNASNQGDPTYRYTIDFTLASVNVAPTVTAPTHAVVAGGTLGNPTPDAYTVPVRAEWTASDPDDGIAFQILRGQVDDGGFVELATSIAEAMRSYFVPVTIGATNQLQISATDSFGASSAYATGKSFGVRGIQETDCAYEGLWTKQGALDAWGGTYMSTEGSASPSLAGAGGAMATCRFAGSSVALVGMAQPDGGRAQVYIDGVQRGIVDFYAVKPMSRQVLLAVNDLGDGDHEIEVRWIDASNEYSTGYRLYLDGVVAID